MFKKFSNESSCKKLVLKSAFQSEEKWSNSIITSLDWSTKVIKISNFMVIVSKPKNFKTKKLSL
jgi:hypothetical protein